MHVCIGLGCEQSAHAAAAVQSHGHRPLAAAPPRRSHAPCTSTIAPCRARREKRRVSHGRVTGYAWRILGVFSQSRGSLFAVHQIHESKGSCSPSLELFVLPRMLRTRAAREWPGSADRPAFADDVKRSMCAAQRSAACAAVWTNRRTRCGMTDGAHLGTATGIAAWWHSPTAMLR
jgi:hypothetical protein